MSWLAGILIRRLRGWSFCSDFGGQRRGVGLGMGYRRNYIELDRLGPGLIGLVNMIFVNGDVDG